MRWCPFPSLYRSHGEGATLSFILNMPPHAAASSSTGSDADFRVGGGAGSGLVWLCECQKGFQKYPATMGDLDGAASVFVDVHVDEAAARRPDFVPKRGALHPLRSLLFPDVVTPSS